MFDQLLYRPIVENSPFEGLLPDVPCNKTLLGSGNTDYSVDMMFEIVKKYAWQTQAVAEELVEDNLRNTISNIHNFVYSHFQYKADDDDQMLRSPACAWKQRYTGIDCKTYSIISSCLLTNVGLKHYIRKIKQPNHNPTEYTHVYVVVPINQTTGKLKDGYYIIDGTLKNNIEPVFIDKKDTYMDLKHYGLNGYNNNQPNENQPEIIKYLEKDSLKEIQQGLGEPTATDKMAAAAITASTGVPIPPKAVEEARKVINKVKNFITEKQFGLHISCWGGSAIDQTKIKEHQESVNKVYAQFIENINNAIIADDMQALAHAVNIADAVPHLVHNTLVHRRDTGGWRSRCTKDNLTFCAHYNALWDTIFGGALETFLKNFYNFSRLEVTNWSDNLKAIAPIGANTLHDLGITLMGDAPLHISSSDGKYTFSGRKAGVEKVPFFGVTNEMTAYLNDRNLRPHEQLIAELLQGNDGGYDQKEADDYLQELENEKENPTDPNTSANLTNTGASSTSTMGVGLVGGLLLAGLFLGTMFNKKNKNND